VGSGDSQLVLIVAPIGRDAMLIHRALLSGNIQSEVLPNVTAAAERIRAEEVGALLVDEEALGSRSLALLAPALKDHAPWSALPVLILTTGGREKFQTRLQQEQVRPLGAVTWVEKPVRVATLISSVRAALLQRSLQYERRDAEEALRQSEKLALVGRMSSSIAHEINNPLESVTNLLFILETTPLSPKQREYLDMAQRELTRVSEIAAHTLTFNRQRDVRGKASLSALLDSVLALYQGRLVGLNITVERHYQNTAPFCCYPGELRQVFANLIGNAFDALRQDGGRILLRERAAAHPKSGQSGVRATIADNGEGMNSRVKATLFAAFHSTKGSNGSGLGLWISKGIVEKHHGSIRFRSSTKAGCSGTVFSVFIPLDQSGL
jgi:signal transduction histidine kinase